MSETFEPLTPAKGQLLAKKNNDYFTPCPCCRRWVISCEARSIFNFNIKICKDCAYNEKVMPKFDWTKDLKPGDVLLEQ